MKKLFSKLIVGGATLGAVSATTMTTVSCGSSSDNTNKYVSVLNQAVAKVLQDARKSTATVGIKTNATVKISISKITDAAAAIIKADKLDISTKYFSHLYIFASFKKADDMPAGALNVTQNSSSRPTEVDIQYNNSSFGTKTPADASPELKTLGNISIDIKERHLLVFKKLLSTINYKLNNTAYYENKDAKYTPTTGTNTFYDENGANVVAGVGPFLAVSRVHKADGTKTNAAIGVTKNAMWYTADASAAAVTWYVADYGNYGGANGVLTFPQLAFNDTTHKATSLGIDFATIQWDGATAYIYTGLYSSTHKDQGAIFKKDSGRVLGTTFMVRTDAYKDFKDMTNGAKPSGAGLKHKVMAPTCIGQPSYPQISQPVIAKSGEVVIGQVLANGSKGAASVFSKATLTGLGVGGWVEAKGDQPHSSNNNNINAITNLVSPDGTTGYLLYTGGTIVKYNINGTSWDGGIEYSLGTDHTDDTSITGVASNNGVYAFTSGTNVDNSGTVHMGMKYAAKDTKSGDNKGVKVSQATFTGEKVMKPWSFQDRDVHNGGKNSESIISTGLANQTIVVDDDAKGDLGVVVAQEESGFNINSGVLPGGISNTHGSSMKATNGIAIVNGDKSIYYLSQGTSTIKKTGVSSSTGLVSAVAGSSGLLAINDSILSTGNLTTPVYTDADTTSMVYGSGTSTFEFTGTKGNSLVTVTGATINYTGSALTWEGTTVEVK